MGEGSGNVSGFDLDDGYLDVFTLQKLINYDLLIFVYLIFSIKRFTLKKEKKKSLLSLQVVQKQAMGSISLVGCGLLTPKSKYSSHVQIPILFL